MSRRSLLAARLPALIRAKAADPVSLAAIYDAVEQNMPELIDDEVEPGTAQLKWKHELRWEIESLVIRGELKRRKDLGRGYYST